MTLEIESFSEDFDPHFKIFHELMANKVREIFQPPMMPGLWKKTAAFPRESFMNTVA